MLNIRVTTPNEDYHNNTIPVIIRVLSDVYNTKNTCDLRLIISSYDDSTLIDSLNIFLGNFGPNDIYSKRHSISYSNDCKNIIIEYKVTYNYIDDHQEVKYVLFTDYYNVELEQSIN